MKYIWAFTEVGDNFPSEAFPTKKRLVAYLKEDFDVVVVIKRNNRIFQKSNGEYLGTIYKYKKEQPNA